MKRAVQREREDSVKKDVDINADINTQINRLKAKIKSQAESYVPKEEVKPKTPEDEIFWFGPPVSPKEFIESREYFNNKDQEVVFPWVIETMEELFSAKYYAPKYNTAVIIAGKGSGKSYLAGMINVYLWYWLLSFRNFSKFLKDDFNVHLDSTTTLQLVGMAPHEKTAFDIVYNETSKLMRRVKFLREHNWLPDPKVKKELQFSTVDELSGAQYKKLVVVPGNSSETFALGLALFGGVIDEACFWAQKKTNPVVGVYDEFNTRRFTRFGNNGIVTLISSANVGGDFVESFEDKAHDDKSIFFQRRSTWDSNPRFFNSPRFEYKVKHERFDGKIEDLIVRPPEDQRPLYELNPTFALKHYDGIPSLAGSPFYPDFALLMTKINRERVDPCPDLGLDKAETPLEMYARLSPACRGVPGCKYRIHVDLAKGNLIKGHCGVGFAMCHKIVDPNLNFKIKLDLAVRFKAPGEKEIQISDILQVVLNLKLERGFDIELVTFDQYQSQMPKQTITGWNNGIQAEELAVGYKQHFFLKSCINSSQFDMYEDHNLLYELKRIEDYGNECIDHGINSFMDESDAVAGAAFSAAALDSVIDVPTPPRVTRGIIISRQGNGPGSYRSFGNNFPKYRK